MLIKWLKSSQRKNVQYKIKSKGQAKTYYLRFVYIHLFDFCIDDGFNGNGPV